MRRICGLLLGLSLFAAAAVAAEGPRVSFELVTERGLPPTAPQQWQRALSQVGITGLRIRSITAADEIRIDKLGTRTAPAYKVVGLLTADNMLYVPGGKFTLRDIGKLRKWLNNLRQDGTEGVTGQRGAFGMTASQLEQIDADLKRSVSLPTKGLSAIEAVQRISRGLSMPLALAPGASRALAEVELRDELQGLSSGTALAAIVRPAGLTLAPSRQAGGQLQYRVGRPQSGGQVWPVGWKPQKRKTDVMPGLYEMLNVEIREISVAEALAAIEGRLKVPFLFDRNAMALHNADPAAVEANVPEKRMSYSQVLRRVLAQGKLRYELRVDEAEKPFLWITTVKRAP